MKETSKFLDYLPAVAFSACIFIPFALNLFISNTEATDNRALHERPQKFDRAFPALYEAYYNDAFALRPYFLKAYARVKAYVGTSANKSIIFGTHGYLFYDSEPLGKHENILSITDYFGREKYSAGLKKRALDNINNLSAYAQKHGAQYFLYIVPNKENVYSQYMPRRYRAARTSAVSRADEALAFINANSKANVYNLKNFILEFKKKKPLQLYFKTDTHWTPAGAYAAFALMMGKINIRVTPFEEARFTQIPRDLGDIAKAGMLNLPDTSYKVTFEPNFKYACDDERTGEALFCRSENINGKKVLLIKDSFGYALLPFFAQVFKEVRVLDKIEGQQKIKETIADFGPDIIIEIKSERNFPFVAYALFTP